MDQSSLKEIMKALSIHSQHIQEDMRGMEKRLDTKIKNLEKKLDTRITNLENTMDKRFDRLDELVCVLNSMNHRNPFII